MSRIDALHMKLKRSSMQPKLSPPSLGLAFAILAALSATAIASLASGCSHRSNTTASSANDNPGPGDPPESSCEVVTGGFGPAGTARVQAEVVADGLVVPWSIAFLPGGDVLLTEREGKLRLVRAGALLPDPIATVAVSTSGEGGLLGLALHPSFADNRQFFLYYSAKKDDRIVNRIARWIFDDAETPSAHEDAIIFDDIPAFTVHDGGRLRFGPDGMLYAGTGDARKPERAQDLASPSGKLLRINTNGEAPADNPHPGNPAYLLGLRNPEAFDWLDDGRVVLADHGPSGELGRTAHDEVNVARAGQNLGWPDIYGCERRAGMVTPLVTFDEAMPPGGGAYYRADAIPAWKDSFLVGTLGSKHLHRFVFDPAGRRVTKHEVYFHGDPPGGFGRLRAVVTGPDGAIYVTTSNCDGRGECPPTKDALLRISAEPGTP